MKANDFRYYLPATAVVLLLMAALVFMPSVLMIFAGTSSFATGVLAAAMLIVAVAIVDGVCKLRGIKTNDIKVIISILCLLGFVLAHYAFVSAFIHWHDKDNLVRFVGGYVGLAMVLFGAFVTARAVIRMPGKILERSISWILLAMLVNLVISTSRIDFFDTGNIKPSFMFIEPSHLALVASSLVMFSALISQKTRLLTILVIIALWGVYIQNLTTIVLFLMVLVVAWPGNLIVFVPIAVVFIAMVIGVLGVDSFQYFSERLNFSPESQNLSVLVFMQGIDNAYRTLESTMWLGAGLQQLGIASVDGPYTDRVLALAGADQNRYDGGLTGSKLVAEFGVFGIVAIIAHLLLATRSFFLLRKLAVLPLERKQEARRFDILMHSVIITSLLEIYVRGIGYFSPMMFMLMVSLMILGMTGRGDRMLRAARPPRFRPVYG